MSEKLTYEDRKQLYIDSVTFNHPKRILFNAYQMGWMYTDMGLTLDVASRDYYMSELAMDTFMQKYPNVDALGTASNGFRYHFRATDPLGGGAGYHVNGDGMERGNVNAVFEDLMSPDDYDEYLNNFPALQWKIFFNAYPDAKNMTPEQIAKAAQEVTFKNEARAKVTTKIRDKYGVLIPYPDGGGLSTAIDDFFNSYRGIKGLAMDLRRRKDKVYEVCAALDEQRVNAAIAHMESLPDGYGVGIKNYYDTYIGALAHTILNPKQIEQLFLKPWKKYFDVLEKKSKNAYCNIEGGFAHTPMGDFFNSYKKGTLCICVEQDDPFEVRKMFPNISIFGGLSVDVMGNGTVEEAVDLAKKAIDELAGPEGGLYLSMNKMVSYDWDLRSDTLKAVSDFCASYELN